MKKTFPVVSCSDMREIDRRAVAEFGMSVETLMENAGRAVADQTVKLIKNSLPQEPRKIMVFCGGGNNGGDGMVAARWLKNKGFDVRIVLLKPAESLKGINQLNFQKIKNDLPCDVMPPVEKIKTDLAGAAIIIDALLGTGFEGPVNGIFSETIKTINASGIPVVSVDVPSGLDADSGEAHGPCVRAALTVTMGAAKIGFLKEEARGWIGKLVVADIGFPEELFKK